MTAGRRHVVAAVAAVVVLAGGFAVARAVAPPADPPAAAPAPGPYRICPLATCTGYPIPSQVRGITISGLQSWLIQDRMIYKQISSMRAWHANTVRLQILQDKLVGERGQRWSPRYMAIVARFVRYALRKHMTVVLADQTELSLGWTTNETLPTHATAVFWDRMTTRWGHDKRIVFDLFNEPRKCTWGQWAAAMQPLVTHVRAAGSLNQIWVEGRWWGSTLEGVPLLHGQGLVYTYHHPGSPWPYQSASETPATWDAAFGYLTSQGVPVVDGEWTNYIGGYYWPRMVRNVTRYLAYLHAHGIGLVAWSLAAGVMSSVDYSHAIGAPQADGRLIQRYFWGELVPSAKVEGAA